MHGLLDVIEGDEGAEGKATLYAFLKVLRTVGDAVGSDTKGSESAVFDFPKVLGTQAVCSVSFGLDVRGALVLDEGRV